MGASGLFDRWAVRVAGALSWFYGGGDGEYEYWPDGTDALSARIPAPFGNEALIADNDRMPHRVGAIGDPAEFAARAHVAADSALDADPGGGRTITGPQDGPRPLADHEIRVSILWKALTFAHRADARRFDDHVDDLDLGTVVRTIHADLARRGPALDEPADPLADPEWSRLVATTYITVL
jgi:hypothetical protein